MLPFLALASFLILIEDGIPLFFKQSRLGLNQEKFTIYKIRTLKKDAPQVGTHEINEYFKLRAGKIIRSLKLDEFPQLINVIRGDLNLIGPRPGLISQTQLEKVRVLEGIYKTKPGITGLAQVLGYDMSNPEKLAEVDKLYIENKTLMLNLIIFLATFFKFPRNHLSSKFKIVNFRDTNKDHSNAKKTI
jgi:O-antigen biosynthesis protein WbqP